MRDADFAESTKRTLAQRVGYRCSNPQCIALTSGPQIDSSKSLNIGVAAHIVAAASGGPRYSRALSTVERLHIENGIWLCQSCAKLIDNDPPRFSAEVLNGWKKVAEAEALSNIGKTAAKEGEVALAGPHHIHFEEDLELETNARFGFSFLYPKNWDRRDADNNDGNIYTHPKDSSIEMRAWGNHAVVFPILDQLVGATLDFHKSKTGFRTLRDVESGRHVYRRGENASSTATREQIRGRRVVFEYDEDSGHVIAMLVLTQFQDIQFAILLRAAAAKFKHYEDLFIVLGQSLRVMSEHPDAQPSAKAAREDAREQESIVLCPVCGNQPGTARSCLGGGVHKFSQFPGPANLLYCPSCGKQPGTPNSCVGGGSHAFAQFSGVSSLIYCPRCGRQPGTPDACPGGQHHQFSQFQGPSALLYCPKCGRQPGTPSLCISGGSHQFSQFSRERIYCQRCGKQPGTPDSCLGGRLHEFAEY